MAVDWIERRRQLNDWRDYWLSELVIVMRREAKVLAYDLGMLNESFSIKARMLNSKELEAQRWTCIDAWAKHCPILFLQEAGNDLSKLARSEVGAGASENFALKMPSLRTPAFNKLMHSQTTSLPNLTHLIHQAIYGQSDLTFSGSGECLIESMSNEILRGFSAACEAA